MSFMKNKVAVVFAANGAIASEVAKAYAENEAEVFASGRNLKSIEELAVTLRTKGATVHAHQVDAMDEEAIDEYLQTVFAKAGKVDVVFNGIGLRAADLQFGTPSTELPYHLFMKALDVSLGSQFLTARIAARHMMQASKPGTIIMLSASLSRIKTPFMAGITAACAGIEGLTRSLAAEYGQAGIRVVCLNSTALGETRTIRETTELNARQIGIPAEVMAQQMQQGYLLGKFPTTHDIGRLAVFLGTETGALLNSHVIDADFGAHNVI